MIFKLFYYYGSLLIWHITPVRLVKKMQIRKFRKIYNYAIKNSAFYRRFYKENGVLDLKIKTFDDIQKIPTINKQILRANNLEDFITQPLANKITHTTSGSSGEPSVLAVSKYENFTAHMRVFFILRKVAKYKPWKKIIMITRYEESAKLNVEKELSTISKIQNIFKLFQRDIISIYSDPDYMIEMIQKGKPHILWSTPSVLEILVNRLVEKNIEMHIPYLIFTSEALSTVQYNKFRKYISKNIVDIYGSMESPTLGYEVNKSGKRIVFPNSNLFEFINQRDMDGKLVGDILITNLVNKVMPIIRYDLNDFGIIVKNINFPHKEISEIIGRLDDILTFPDGKLFVHHHAAEMFMDFKECDQYKFEQYVNKPIKLLLKPNNYYTKEEIEDKAIERWNRRFKKYPLQIQFVEKFYIDSKTGKFKNIEKFN